MLTVSSKSLDALTGNFLLSNLPAEVRELMLAHLEPVELRSNEIIYQSEDYINHVYFPVDAVVSGLAIMMDGATTEIAMTGREGLVGIAAIIGGGHAQHWTRVQVEGTALRMKTEEMDRLFHEYAAVQQTMLRAYRALITQISQRAVCNARHTVMQRLCCWLLMIHDRVGSNDLAMTQEIIAGRLGARRAGITVAAGTLQNMRAISYGRGRIRIDDREALESTVCECYLVHEKEFKSLQGAARRSAQLRTF
jgi:CRP-like cAMP-binding protein